MIKLLFLITCLSIFACSNNDTLAGGSTVETENASKDTTITNTVDSAFAIYILNADSTPAQFASATIRPHWYVKSISPKNASANTNVQTDSSGRILLNNISDEVITLEILGETSGVFTKLQKKDIKKGNSVTFTMEKFGALKGNVKIPEGKSFAWVQVYGTDKLLKTDSLGKFSIDSLPPADYLVRTIISEDSAAIGEAMISVNAEKTKDAGTLPPPSEEGELLSLWQYSRTLELSEVSSDWMQPLADTTIVFVRLDSTNFNFHEAGTSGLDLRFTDQDGNRLNSKIASWDDSLQNAKILVRLNGTSSIRNLKMYWGKSAAIDVNKKDIWNNISDSLLQAINSVTLIDFETGKLESAYESGEGRRGWYFEPQNSNVTTFPSKENVSDGFERDEERNSTVFHWRAETTAPGQWSMIGSRICQQPMNFSGLDSVSFYAKGSGELGFVFEALNEPTGKVKYVDNLNSEWTRYSIIPQNFVEGDSLYGNMGWDFVKPRLTTVTFWIVDNAEVWIDDISLYGVNRDDLN